MTPVKNTIAFEVFYRSLGISCLPLNLRPKLSADKIVIALDPIKDLQWKQSSNVASCFERAFKEFSSIRVTKQNLTISKNISKKNFSAIIERLDTLVDQLARENLFAPRIWPNTQSFYCKGFDDKASSLSTEALEELYADAFMVAEKKPFVLDLDASFEARMCDSFDESSTFFDGAAQIASLALGYNNEAKNAMLLKPELLCEKQNIEKSEIYRAFCHLLKTQSGLEHIQVVNSGAEAVECALRACQKENPARSKILAFKGSFHGRTLLALHCTHNPSKREPYEIFKGLVQFLDFPEDKTPHLERHEPNGWLQLWNETNDNLFGEHLQRINTDLDDILEEEIRVLSEIRHSLKQEAPLAFITEPMLCEGGDKYASARFFRALRVLTRAFKTPLIMDEVQCGFGLGGPFFWHKGFKFEDVDGKADTPDCLCLAKKAQAAACLTLKAQDSFPTECSLASLYRGYLQGQEVLRSDITLIERRSRRYLKLLQDQLAPGVLLYPRVQGMAFSFDVNTKEIANALVAARFRNGVLFYHAGDQTLRFRMLLDASEEDFAELFTGIRKCFLELEKSGAIAQGKTFEEWRNTLGDASKQIDQKRNTKESLFEELKIPKTLEAFSQLKQSEWVRIFRSLVKHLPQLLYSRENHTFTLAKLEKISLGDIWSYYLIHSDFCFVDFVWQASRKMSHSIEILNSKGVEKFGAELDALEKRVYEPARREELEKLIAYSKEPRSIFLIARDSDKKIKALCVGAPLKTFKHVGLIDTDPHNNDTTYLYGVDLTVDPNCQGQGLGFRLKCEQLIQARELGAHCIRSRNRFPEASGMIQLNQRIGSLIIDELSNAYGPKSSPAKYQSLMIVPRRTSLRVRDKRRGALFNKGSLANFVSLNYIDNSLALKEALPPSHRHVYLASGHAEAADKIVKLLKEFRGEAHMCLSIEGDSFGSSTAASRSLGGHGKGVYFDWPAFPFSEKIDVVENFILHTGAANILGFFVEPATGKSPKKKDPLKLKALIKLMKKHEIPVVFHETESSFGKYKAEKFLIGDLFHSDISYFQAAPQLAVVASTKNFFNSKPLMMISTWDGDEMGLHYMRQRLEEWAWS